MLLVIDLWSKAWVFRNLGAHEVKTIVPGLLDFRRSLNDGAVFGTFTGQTSLFIVASLFALGFVLYLFLHSHARQWFLHISLGMILAGALGNLYDRIQVQADVIRVTDRQGRVQSHIGTIVARDENTVVVGDFPDGGSPQAFARSEVEIRRQGVVRDFLKFVPKFPAGWPQLGGWDVWPWIFNVADAALVVGVAMLLLGSLFERSHHTLDSPDAAPG
jgi:lipoprotein signal peptidase